jgi:hypothetical protein
MKAHHMVQPSELTIRGARHALISHLVVGSCAGKCDAIASVIVEHECYCRNICHEFASQQAMAFTTLSTLLSASPDHFPDSHVVLVGESLGWSDHSRANFMRQLDIRRRALLKEHASANTARTLFSNLELIPKGSLVAVAHAHGMNVTDTATCNSLRDIIAEHLGHALLVRAIHPRLDVLLRNPTSMFSPAPVHLKILQHNYSCTY